jgi:UTP--glucose-1-phosphate uridylyltransferase
MIKKAILPVAGFGTRFLPATKAQPKEMLPIVDKPIIQYLVEEVAAAGIEEIIFVTGRGKRSIEDHFDHSFELEHNLVEKRKHDLLKEIFKISKLAKFSYVRQPSPRGDGDAVFRARELVGNEPCAVLFGDDLVDSEVPAIKQLMDVYEKYKDSVIALEQVPKEDVSRYGIVDSITPDVFDTLEALIPAKKDDEVRLADAFKLLLRKKPIYGYEFEGKRYDCGSKLGFLKATVDFGLKHTELNGQFKKYLKNLKIS